MARPRVPLISRRATLEVALKIIDAEGLEALSIRRIARELDVNGASLYHHFRNKDEILLGAAQLALRNARGPEVDDVDWRQWFLSTTATYREALRSHPGLVAIVLTRHPLRIALPFYDASISVLTKNGVPPKAAMPLLDTIESFVIGSVVYAAACSADDYDPAQDEMSPHLARAARVATFPTGDDKLWKACCLALIDAAIEASVSTRKRHSKSPAA